MNFKGIPYIREFNDGRNKPCADPWGGDGVGGDEISAVRFSSLSREAGSFIS